MPETPLPGVWMEFPYGGAVGLSISQSSREGSTRAATDLYRLPARKEKTVLLTFIAMPCITLGDFFFFLSCIGVSFFFLQLISLLLTKIML